MLPCCLVVLFCFLSVGMHAYEKSGTLHQRGTSTHKKNYIFTKVSFFSLFFSHFQFFARVSCGAANKELAIPSLQVHSSLFHWSETCHLSVVLLLSKHSAIAVSCLDPTVLSPPLDAKKKEENARDRILSVVSLSYRDATECTRHAYGGG